MHYNIKLISVLNILCAAKFVTSLTASFPRSGKMVSQRKWRQRCLLHQFA